VNAGEITQLLDRLDLAQVFHDAGEHPRLLRSGSGGRGGPA
jgi:hypothetical protein